MRKKILLLALTLVAVAFSLQAPRAEAASGYACVQCTTFADGSQCCITCWCENFGQFQVQTCPAIGCAQIEL